MYSNATNLPGPAGPIGPWKPHHMIYIPYMTNAQLGGNPPLGDFPFVGGADGGASATVIIPGRVGIDPK